MIKFILLTLIAALILSVLPIPYWAQNFRPLWLLLISLCWILIYPEKFGVGIAWLNGLILDSLQGTLLGENALCFAIIAYILIKMRHWFEFLSIKWQLMIVFLLLTLNQVMLFWLEGLQGHHIPLAGLLGSVFSSVIFWCWMYKLLLNSFSSYKRSAHEYS